VACTLVLLTVNAFVIGGARAANNGAGLQAQQPALIEDPQQSVAARVGEWVGYLNNESVSGLVSLYTAQPKISWGGNVDLLTSTYSGRSNVSLLYSALFANTTFLIAIPSPVNTSTTAPGTVNATFGLNLKAQKGTAGTYEFIINVDQVWVDQNGTWEIQHDIWTNNEYSFSGATTSSTYIPTLGPQWTAEPVNANEPSSPNEPPTPYGLQYESCVTDSDFLYCIGGFNFAYSLFRDAFYAQLGLDGGVGIWQNTTAYPIPVDSPSCVAYPADLGTSTYQSTPSDILCVGGEVSGGPPTNQTYLAQLSPAGGIGKWKAEGAFPVPISGESCVVDPSMNFTSAGSAYSSGYVYCIGGSDGGPSSGVYYAPLGPEPGRWEQTTPYPVPIDGHSCVDSQHYIFCIGGTSYPESVYYAKFSLSGGIAGGWQETTSYPTGVAGLSCVLTGGYNDFVYCIGGLESPNDNGGHNVNFARLSHTGGGIEGSWMPATNFPASGYAYGSCVEALNSIWCDWTGSITHDVILESDIPTVTQTETYAAAIVTVTTTTVLSSFLTTATTTTTATAFSTSAGTSSAEATGIVPASVVYALAGTTAILAASTLFLLTRRKRQGTAA